MAKATSGKQNLTILARVDGAGNVSSEVKKINSSIASVASTSKGTTNDLGGVSKAFETLGTKVAGVNDKLMGMRTKDLSAELKNLGGALGMIPGPVGLVGLAVTSVIGVFSTLKDLLSDGVDPAAEKNKEAILDLAGAYEALGDAASAAAAEEKLEAEAAIKEAKAQVNEIFEQAKAQDALAKAAQAEIEDAQRKLKIMKEQGVIYGREKRDLQLLIAHKKDEVAEHEKAAASARAQLDIGFKQLNLEKDRLKQLTALSEEQKKQEKYAEEQAKKAEAEAEARRKEAEAREKAAAERARQRRQAEIDAVAAYQKTAADAVWAAEEHSAQETLDREQAAKRAAAEASISDASRLADALAAIDMEYFAKRNQQAKKDAEAEQKMRAEIAARAAEVSGGGEDPEIKRINAQLERLRADRAKLLELSGEDYTKYGDLLRQVNEGIELSEKRRRWREEELNEEALDRINKEEQAIKEATYNRIYQEKALTAAQKQAVDAQLKGLDAVSEGLEAWGKGASVIKAAQMTASAILAAADAIDYTAQSIASFAIGNVGAGVGLAAAAAGKTAAAAAYAKGLLELGFSAPSSASSSAASTTSSAPQGSTSQLTGKRDSGETQLNVTMQFSGQAGRLGRYLIEEINTEARTAGGARVNSNVLRR